MDAPGSLKAETGTPIAHPFPDDPGVPAAEDGARHGIRRWLIVAILLFLSLPTILGPAFDRLGPVAGRVPEAERLRSDVARIALQFSAMTDALDGARERLCAPLPHDAGRLSAIFEETLAQSQGITALHDSAARLLADVVRRDPGKVPAEVRQAVLTDSGKQVIAFYAAAAKKLNAAAHGQTDSDADDALAASAIGVAQADRLLGTWAARLAAGGDAP